MKTVTGPRPMAGALFLLLGSAAAAQDVTLSGGVEMTWASRDRVLDEAALWTPGGLAAGSPARVADTFILPQISVRLDIESAPVRVAIELGNQVLHSDSSADPRFQEDRLGEATALRVRLQQAWLELYGLLRAGQQDFLWDPVGFGNPLFLGPSGSESPWGELPDSTVPPFPASGTNTVPQTRRDRINPVGLTLRAEEVTLFALLLSEGGRPAADEALWGGAVTENWGPLRASAVVTLMTGPERKQDVWTAGGALALRVEPFTAAAEGYRQFGTAGVDLRASGYASRGIVRYAEGFWAQGTMVWVSGDRRGDDRREGRFLSYEDNDATLIVEGNEFGLDIDTNYWSAQVSAGFELELFEKRFRPRALAGIFRLLEAVPLPPDPPPGVSGRSRELGTELDGGFELDWSARLTFTAGAAVLFRSGVLEEFTRLRDSRTSLFTAGFRLTF